MPQVKGFTKKAKKAKSRFFADKAVLSSLGLRFDPAQDEFTHWVDMALEHGRHVTPIEAPMGTGKTLGYLAPAMAQAAGGRRVLVSTPLKKLQSQILDERETAAALAGAAGVKGADRARFALIQGTENYICPPAAREEVDDPAILEALLAADDIERILSSVPHGDALASLAVDPDCPLMGKECDECPWPARKQAAAQADIVVANHALALSLFRNGEDDTPPVLGEFHAVVVDEGDLLPAVAKRIWGMELSLDAMVRLVGRALRRRPELERRLEAMAGDLADLKEMAISTGETGGWIRTRGNPKWSILPVEFQHTMLRMARRLEAVARTLDRGSPSQAILYAKCRRLARDAKRFVSGKSGREQTFQLWRGRRGDVYLHLQEPPYKVGGLLKRRFWSRFHAGVLASGTLTWSMVLDALGDHADIRRVETRDSGPRVDRYLARRDAPAYQYAKDNPKGHAEWLGFTARAITRGAVPLNDGGILVLIPAWDDVHALCRLLEERLPPDRPLVEARRGEARKAAARFTATRGRGVLVAALDALGRGVDFSIDELRHVVLPKIPFPKSDKFTQANLRRALDRTLQAIGRLPAVRLAAAGQGHVCGWWLLDSRVWKERDNWKYCVDKVSGKYPPRRSRLVGEDGSVAEEK